MAAREMVSAAETCSRCGTTPDGADRGKISAAQPPPWAHPGSISDGPRINTAAALLTSYGNVPAERLASRLDGAER
jgi:hypothetical protein